MGMRHETVKIAAVVILSNRTVKTPHHRKLLRAIQHGRKKVFTSAKCSTITFTSMVYFFQFRPPINQPSFTVDSVIVQQSNTFLRQRHTWSIWLMIHGPIRYCTYQIQSRPWWYLYLSSCANMTMASSPSHSQVHTLSTLIAAGVCNILLI